jgi:hypothetical protein
MTAAFIDRTINGKHTFACALTTRGGICDCWPDQPFAPPAMATASEVDFVEHCDWCSRRRRSPYTLVDLDGTVQLCERCARHAEDAERADPAKVIDL